MKQFIIIALFWLFITAANAQETNIITMQDILDGRVDTIIKTNILGDAKILQRHAFSPDSQRLAFYGFMSSSIEIWDIPSASLLFSLPKDDNTIDAITFSPDNQYFASVQNHEVVYIWDMTTGQQIRTFPIDDYTTVFAAGFTPNSSYFAIQAADVLDLYNIQSGELEVTVDAESSLEDYRFSPDGRLLAILLGDGSVTLYETDALTVIKTFTANAPVEARLGPRNIQFSASGKSIVVAEVPDAVQVWDITADEPTFQRYTGLAYRTLFLSGDYLRWLPRLVDNDVIEIFNIDTNEVIGRVSDLPKSAVGFTFSHDGTFYVAVRSFFDDDPATVTFYHHFVDVKAGKPLRSIAYEFIGSYFSPSGEYIMSWNTDGELFVSGIKD